MGPLPPNLDSGVESGSLKHFANMTVDMKLVITVKCTLCAMSTSSSPASYLTALVDCDAPLLVGREKVDDSEWALVLR